MESIVTKSRVVLTSTNCFPVLYVTTDSTLSFQRNISAHVMSLERGDFRLSIGNLNNKFPFMVEGLLNILQSVLCLGSQDFDMAANSKKERKAESYEQKRRKRQVK